MFWVRYIALYTVQDTYYVPCGTVGSAGWGGAVQDVRPHSGKDDLQANHVWREKLQSFITDQEDFQVYKCKM